MAGQKALFFMADYGNDPSEVAIPYSVFKKAEFEVTFATENGKTPACDKKMLEGWTQKFLGATSKAVSQYKTMADSKEFKNPVSWSAPEFLDSIKGYDILFLPGGHEKGVRQQIDSETVHQAIATFWPLTNREVIVGGKTKCVGAICHGVMTVAATNDPEDKDKSVLHNITTTALPAMFEGFAYQSTRLMLGDYYKTYGPNSPSVEAAVKQKLKDPQTQWKSSLAPSPFIVEDKKHAYVSGRFPPDAEKLAQRCVEIVQNKSG